MRPVDVHQSLHAQGEVFQLKYLAQQADALLDGIDDLIAATRTLGASPNQTALRADTRRTRHSDERGSAMGACHLVGMARADREDFIPGVCSSVVSYQVMLRDSNTDKKWARSICSADHRRAHQLASS